MNPDGSNTTETDGYIFTTRPGTQETGGTFTIFNKRTGKQQEHVWGDPHTSSGDFHGTTTFLLDDGTKATLETSRYKDTDATLLSAVTLTNGANGIRTTGVSDGRLSVTRYDGRYLDRSVQDGMTLYSTENGLRGTHGEVANQEYMNTHDRQLNPWLDDEPDARWQDDAYRGRNPFERGSISHPVGRSDIHRHLNDLVDRLQSTLRIHSMQLEGRFSGFNDVPWRRYGYDSSSGWSVY